MDTPTQAIRRLQSFLDRARLTLDAFDHVGQLLAAQVATAMAHNPLWRVQRSRRDAAELRGFLLARPEPRDLIDQRLGIQLPGTEPLTPGGRSQPDEANARPSAGTRRAV